MSIDIDSNSNTRQVKNKKCWFEQISFTGAIIESKRIDMEFCWVEYNYCYKNDKYVGKKKAIQFDKIM